MEEKNTNPKEQTPGMDNSIIAQNIPNMKPSEVKKALIAIKKRQEACQKQVYDLEEKNYSFETVYRERNLLKKIDDDLLVENISKFSEKEIKKKRLDKDFYQKRYDRHLSNMTVPEKANFDTYCALLDEIEENKALITDLEKNSTKELFSRKTLSILGSLLVLSATASYLYNKIEDKKPLQASIVQKSGAKNASSVEQKDQQKNEQVSKKASADKEKVSIAKTTKEDDCVKDFENCIKRYSSQTQEAMRMSIDWLKKYNSFTKARAKNDNLARLTAKLEMDDLGKGIQQLDKTVWFVVNDRIGPDFVKQDQENPGCSFDLKPVYILLPKVYDSIPKTEEKAKKVEISHIATKVDSFMQKPKEKMQKPKEKPRVLAGNYSKALELSIQMLHKMDLYFTLHSINPNDTALLSLNREMSTLAEKIEHAQPALYAYLVQENRQIADNYAKTGVVPKISIDAYKSKLETVAIDLQANPQKATELYAEYLRNKASVELQKKVLQQQKNKDR